MIKIKVNTELFIYQKLITSFLEIKYNIVIISDMIGGWKNRKPEYFGDWWCWIYWNQPSK